MITERGLDRFVMECVETANPIESEEIESGMTKDDYKGLDLAILLREVKAS